MKPDACIRVAVALSATSGLSACAGHISDVHFVSVTPADTHVHLIRVYNWPERADLGPLLKLRFASSVDLRDAIDRYDAFTTDLVITPCPFNETETVGGVEIYHNDISVSAKVDLPPGLGESVEDNAALRAEAAKTGPAETPRFYDAYFHYGYFSHFDDTSHAFVRRPMQGDPPDLCFRVLGRAWPLGGFKSNEVVIPRADLVAALARQP